MGVASIYSAGQELTPYHASHKIWRSILLPADMSKHLGQLANSVDPDKASHSARTALGPLCFSGLQTMNTFGCLSVTGH